MLLTPLAPSTAAEEARAGLSRPRRPVRTPAGPAPLGQFPGGAVELVIERAVRDFALAALVEQANYGFELLDRRCIGPFPEHELRAPKMVAAAVTCAESPSVQ